MCAVLNAIVDTPVVFFSPLNDRNQKDELRVIEDSNLCHGRFENDKVTPADNTRPIINRKYKESVGEM